MYNIISYFLTACQCFEDIFLLNVHHNIKCIIFCNKKAKVG